MGLPFLTYGVIFAIFAPMEKELTAVRETLMKAESVAVLTGAGISAESGVPTFRGEDGLWRNHNVMDLVTPQGFARDPQLVWEFYNWRRDLIDGITYNPAHKALVDLEARVPDFTLISQNVDGLHLKAGSKNLLEIHGNLWKVRCTECHKITLDYSSDMGPLPKCRDCGGLLRPHVVWFGESLDYDLLQQAIEASRNARVMLVIGTSAVVQPAASLAMEAKGGGAIVVEINLEKTPQSGSMDFTLLGKAGEIVPRLLENWP
jgi:NAD-dependent deacetylase